MEPKPLHVTFKCEPALAETIDQCRALHTLWTGHSLSRTAWIRLCVRHTAKRMREASESKGLTWMGPDPDPTPDGKPECTAY